ncbi:hypothetical protein FVEN_g7703 [Fusarium venenatum]|uniref:Uncharacterized protein n=1 Tax=Fusarium venenatum TaxID=56646 RepID=A0A2L2TUV7_9HYPO|nr:uncharacterized protein FVRRES_08103 [Fusarium venenatum]KAG8354419.1 hypothetical protein FVEN_g7703 [Fusarium venenatum]KAH6964890.1 hypothetical protein EDB82DRAFT_547808 [Fusarium venenatum]CEI68026.1 unnamed protein product [Fusarium venenatum]
MLVNIFTTTVIIACAFLAAPVLGSPIDVLPDGLESHLQSRASDFTVRFWDTTLCKTERSKKDFNSGHCIKRLAEKDHAVSMVTRKATKCHMIRYREHDCKGYSEKVLNLKDCFNIGDEWESLKFKC